MADDWLIKISLQSTIIDWARLVRQNSKVWSNPRFLACSSDSELLAWKHPTLEHHLPRLHVRGGCRCLDYHQCSTSTHTSQVFLIQTESEWQCPPITSRAPLTIIWPKTFYHFPPPVCLPKNWERNPCWQFDSFLRTSNRSKSSAANGSVMENQTTNMHFKGCYCNQWPLLSPPTHKITRNIKNIMRSVSPIQYHWYYTNNGDSTPTPSSAVKQPHHPELHPPDGRRHWHLQHARHTAWPAHVPHRCRTILALYWKCYEYEQQLLWLCWRRF